MTAALKDSELTISQPAPEPIPFRLRPSTPTDLLPPRERHGVNDLRSLAEYRDRVRAVTALADEIEARARRTERPLQIAYLGVVSLVVAGGVLAARKLLSR